MRRFSLNNYRFVLTGILILLIGTLTFWFGCDQPTESPADPQYQVQQQLPDQAISALQMVMEVQERHTEKLMQMQGVVGTGTGLTENGNPVVRVYTVDHNVKGIPALLDGVPVDVKVTGRFVAQADPTARFPRPVPIGVSSGHPDITAGTLGARVRDGSGNVYALSNNHVYADINNAAIGDDELQPGAYDGGTAPEDVIGTLHDYEPILFDGPENKMDAAIALTSTGQVGTATPNDGYGTPSSTIKSASVGQSVQKYGRTTGFTTGEVSEINVTVNVCYETAGPFRCKTYATFVDQIAITTGTFSDGGDSGSLIVTNDNKNPVGLLFAGSDTRTLANPIGAVLNRFNVTIDDGSSSSEENSPPSADFTYSTSGLTAEFTDQSTDSDGTIASWNWDFGDDNTSTAQNPSHTYSADGTYTVSLTVSDDDGATDATTQDVIVSEEVNSDVTVSDIDPSSASSGSVVVLTITGSGFVSGASVTFENGSGPAPETSDVTVTDESEITASVTIKSGGPPKDRVWDVRVTNPDGTGDVLANGFTVTP